MEAEKDEAEAPPSRRVVSNCCEWQEEEEKVENIMSECFRINRF